MEIEIVRVTPGMLPPIIKTTPNSPRVWAKLRIIPVKRPGHAIGTTTRKKVPTWDTPRHQDASTRRRSTPANAATKGRTANGKLYSTEAASSPAKENGHNSPV